MTAAGVETSTDTPYLSALQRDGFVIIPSLLSAGEIRILRDAATTSTKITRSGRWPFFRTVPKQFPPWPKELPPASEGGIWGVQHLLHPDMRGRQQYAEFYFSEKVLAVVEELLGLTGRKREVKQEQQEEEPLVMELFNLLVAPEHKDFELRWHRDDIPETVTPDEEMRLLKAKSPKGRQSHAQYNLALCPDSSLIVIPGSHRRIRTTIERDAASYEPHMPGQQIVHLEPGDAVFYDSNILHRGVYKHKFTEEETRLTLHGSVGLSSTVLSAVKGDGNDIASGAKVRATAVLQHSVGTWIDREDASLSHISDRAEVMRKNLIAMGRGEDAGYSLEG